MTTAGRMAKQQDMVELQSDDHRVLTSHILSDDNQWHEIRMANCRRLFTDSSFLMNS